MIFHRHHYVDAYDRNGRAFAYCKHCYKRRHEMFRKRKFEKESETEVYVQFCFFGKWITLARMVEGKETPQVYEKDMGPATYRYNSGTDETEIIKNNE